MNESSPRHAISVITVSSPNADTLKTSPQDESFVFWMLLI